MVYVKLFKHFFVNCKLENRIMFALKNDDLSRKKNQMKIPFDCKSVSLPNGVSYLKIVNLNLF